MKVRTVEQLGAIIDDDYTWRFFELLVIQDSIKKSNNLNRRCYLRAGIAMLYAHWEGFIKCAAEAYLIYVATKRQPVNRLNYPFISLALRHHFRKAAAENKSSTYCELVQFLFENINERLPIPYRGVIQTHSNLNSKTFRDVVQTIGLDYSVYQLKEKIIDGKLLYYRNSIAHGEYLEIDPPTFYELHDYIVSIMQQLKDQIIDAAITENYLTTEILT